MKTWILFLLIALGRATDPSKENVSSTSSPTSEKTTVKTINSMVNKAYNTVIRGDDDIGVRHLSSPTHRRNRFPLPPVAMPGITNDHDPSVSKRKVKRAMLLSELRLLKNQYLPLERSLNRVRRAPPHPELIVQIPKIINRRSQRDLRRLRRDLGYDTTPDFSSYQTQYPPQLHHPQSVSYGQYPPHLNQPSISYGQRAHRPPTAIRGKELERLLEGLDFLEQLAIMNQDSKVTPSMASGGHHRRVLHAPPSRFAPQPKLFMDDILQHRPLRVQNEEENPEDLMWIPEKRWSKSRSSMSLIPGFKKRSSSFREAAKLELMEQRSKRQKSVSSLATILGGEVDPAVNMVHRTIM